VGYSVHGQAGDTTCLIPHLDQVRENLEGQLPKKIVADAAYGSEENYAYLESMGWRTISSTIPSTRTPIITANLEILRAHQFRAENFGYDQATDQFICPADKRLHFLRTSSYTTDNG